MINSIRLIRNLGQFESVDNGANIPLRRLTVVFSENGRGKTTIAAVLRSLATGDPIPIAERKRLASEHPPYIVLECSGGPPPARFEDNAWNRTLTELVVFDDEFIDQNVHSGLAVETHHRQNLHELILGAPAVTLAKRLQQTVVDIEQHNRELRGRQNAFPSVDLGPYTIDEFCALPARLDIEALVGEAERALLGAQEQVAVRTTPPFEMLTLPQFDLEAVDRLLQQGLTTVEAAATARVQEHFAELGDGGEEWVAEGMRRLHPSLGFASTGLCPFCAQDLVGSQILHHYQAYFSHEYITLKFSVASALEVVTRDHSGETSAAFERAVRVAVQRQQFWTRFCEIDMVEIDTEAVVSDWQAARAAIVAQLVSKQSAPLETMQLSRDTRELAAAYRRHAETVVALNARMSAANMAIEVAKERAASADVVLLGDDLARLKAARARQSQRTAELCDGYLTEKAAKVATEQLRDDLRAELETHRSHAFPGYQAIINTYLARFGAGFRLDAVSYANTRGGPTCTYSVVINNVTVPVGVANVPSGAPSFRTTLSAGDRNTLALAFFFAALDQDTDLARKVVVIDDPISSLDEHRTMTTVQHIRNLAARAAQVIVLSHNRPFLCRLWDGTNPSMGTAIEVVRHTTGSTLQTWDVAQDSITEHDRRDAVLSNYLTDGVGDRREVATLIRPHLEGYLRVACPSRFPPGTLLGPFMNICQGTLTDARPVLSDVTLRELREIVEFANRFHHDTNPAWQTEAINDGELRGFVEKAMAFVRP